MGKIPWRKEWLPTPVILLGEFHGQLSLAGYRVHGVTNSQDMTEQLTQTHTKLEREIQIMDLCMEKRTINDFKRLVIDIREKVK